MYASTQYAGVAGVEPGAGPPVVVRAGFGWQRAVAAAALQTLLAAIDATVPAFATPPAGAVVATAACAAPDGCATAGTP